MSSRTQQRTSTPKRSSSATPRAGVATTRSSSSSAKTKKQSGHIPHSVVANGMSPNRHSRDNDAEARSTQRTPSAHTQRAPSQREKTPTNTNGRASSIARPPALQLSSGHPSRPLPKELTTPRSAKPTYRTRPSITTLRHPGTVREEVVMPTAEDMRPSIDTPRRSSRRSISTAPSTPRCSQPPSQRATPTRRTPRHSSAPTTPKSAIPPQYVCHSVLATTTPPRTRRGAAAPRPIIAANGPTSRAKGSTAVSAELFPQEPALSKPKARAVGETPAVSRRSHSPLRPLTSSRASIQDGGRATDEEEPLPESAPRPMA